MCSSVPSSPAASISLAATLGRVGAASHVAGLDVHDRQHGGRERQRHPRPFVAAALDERFQHPDGDIELPRLLEALCQHESGIAGGLAVELVEVDSSQAAHRLGGVAVGEREPGEVDLETRVHLRARRPARLLVEEPGHRYAEPFREKPSRSFGRGALAGLDQ